MAISLFAWIRRIREWHDRDGYTRSIAETMARRFGMSPYQAHVDVLEFRAWLTGDAAVDAESLEGAYDCNETDPWPCDRVCRASHVVEALRVMAEKET